MPRLSRGNLLWSNALVGSYTVNSGFAQTQMTPPTKEMRNHIPHKVDSQAGGTGNTGIFLKLKSGMAVDGHPLYPGLGTGGPYRGGESPARMKEENLDPYPLDFDDTNLAFSAKPTSQLLLGLVVFKACSIRTLVRNADKVLLTAKQFMGDDLVTWAIRQTFFKHFCGGAEHESQLPSVFNEHRSSGIGALVFYSAESEIDNCMSSHELEKAFSANHAKLVNSLRAAASAPGTSFAAIKVTSLADHGLLMKLSEMFVSGGRSLQHLDELLHDLGAGRQNPAAQLTLEDMERVTVLMNRLEKIGEIATNLGVRVLVDAEQTWIQPGIDYVTLKLQKKFNKHRAVFLNTYQCYLKDSFHRLVEDTKMAHGQGYIFGGKLVRGAYMQSEQDWAEAKGSEWPIHDGKLQTDSNYNRCVGMILDEIASGSGAEMVVATHNRASVETALHQMSRLGLGKDAPVHFAQLYGMADYLTYSLGHGGFNVMKLISYGPIDKVLPFLIRRAQENSSVLGGAQTDIDKLKSALYSRLSAKLRVAST